jgi:hypothetical protein
VITPALSRVRALGRQKDNWDEVIVSSMRLVMKGRLQEDQVQLKSGYFATIPIVLNQVSTNRGHCAIGKLLGRRPKA